MGIDKLLYFKHDVIGADLMMLACKSTEAFTAYFVLYSYCFEHALLSIPKNIALERVSDFTDNVDKTVDILVKRGLAIISDTEIIIVGAPERVQNGMDISKKYAGYQKNYRERQKNKVNQSNEQQSDNYNSLVEKWDNVYKMSDIQVKTSKKRLKDNTNWSVETVLNAIEFISNNINAIKNKILCDWYESGFLVDGYEFDLNTINEYFEKKGKSNSVKKSNTTDPTGCNVNYNDQGWGESKKVKVTEIDNTMDIHMKRMLDAAGV